MGSQEWNPGWPHARQALYSYTNTDPPIYIPLYPIIHNSQNLLPCFLPRTLYHVTYDLCICLVENTHLSRIPIFMCFIHHLNPHYLWCQTNKSGWSLKIDSNQIPLTILLLFGVCVFNLGLYPMVLRGLFLVPCSRVTPGGNWGISVVPGIRTQDCRLQGKHLNFCIMLPILSKHFIFSHCAARNRTQDWISVRLMLYS